MSLYDLRATVASWVRKQGGKVDPAIYANAYGSTVGYSAQLSFKPDGKRGPFVCFGLARPALAAAPPFSKVSLNVEGKRITYNGVFRSALCHNEDTSFQGIHYSQWPAPVIVEAAASLTLAETCFDSSQNLQSLIYMVAGFHTDEAMIPKLRSYWGELRAFAIELAPAAASDGGNATAPFTVPEDDKRIWLQEFCANDAVAAGGGDLDFIRVSLMSSQLYLAQRVSGSIALALPKRLGIPSAYVGRYMASGDVITVQERVPSTSRRDVWNFLAIAGGSPDVVEGGGYLL